MSFKKMLPAYSPFNQLIDSGYDWKHFNAYAFSRKHWCSTGIFLFATICFQPYSLKVSRLKGLEAESIFLKPTLESIKMAASGFPFVAYRN